MFILAKLVILGLEFPPFFLPLGLLEVELTVSDVIDWRPLSIDFSFLRLVLFSSPLSLLFILKIVFRSDLSLGLFLGLLIFKIEGLMS